MSTGRWTKGLLLGTTAVFAIGCENLLGTFEVAPAETSIPEAGASPDVVTAEGDSGPSNQAIDAGGDGGPAVVRPCEQDIECPAVTMAPAGCASAKCVEKKCVYRPIDKDGDGFPMAGCTVEGKPAQGQGTDCADDEPTVFPGAPCSKLPNGTDITFPNGTPLGACKAGVWDCKTGAPVCQGAVPPAATENCNLKNDANCNGVPDEGCDCTPNTVGPCGNTAGLPLPCKAGTRTCSPEGKWGACSGNIEPKARDCSSTIDNDCSGQADQGENACSCPGGVPQGGSAACTAVGGVGECAKGSWTCMPSGDKQSGVFGPCNGQPPAREPDCKSALDNNCNGVGDELEVACGSPCGLGDTKALTAAIQKFPNGMWGCGGTRTFEVRGQACRTNSTVPSRVCQPEEWLKYGVSTGQFPTRKYWVDEMLGWGGSPGACGAWAGGASCSGTSMSVCPGSKGGETVTDSDGNVCNWTNCSYGQTPSGNHYFGGCVSNNTAGTLCCQ